MEDDTLRLRPERAGDGWLLVSGDSDVAKAIREWGEARERLESGETTQEEYDRWRDTYAPTSTR